jgi:thiamine pyrophosphokinase
MDSCRSLLSSATAVLLANGELPSRGVLRTVVNTVNTVVCADGAANRLRELLPEVKPSFIIGDLDSVSEETLKYYSSSLIIDLSHDQETTDLEKSCRLLKDQDHHRIIVCGFSGGRYDHTISNLLTVVRWIPTLDLLLVDNDGYGLFLDGYDRTACVLDVPRGTTISLIPCGVTGPITTYGLQYPLCGEPLALHGRNGQSNQVLSEPCTVEMRGDPTQSTSPLLVYVNHGVG